MAGEIEIDLQTADGPRLHVLGPGASIYYPGGTPHRWRRQRRFTGTAAHRPESDG
ncbi:hypothetical protein ABT147_33770 [Streptomyces sp. NPDC001868]|uniref:hypothetical protein n=1 Tax=Streptomyces sp. NPDC001868 TaxID=3154401 RepID=UPI00331E5401